MASILGGNCHFSGSDEDVTTLMRPFSCFVALSNVREMAFAIFAQFAVLEWLCSDAYLNLNVALSSAITFMTTVMVILALLSPVWLVLAVVLAFMIYIDYDHVWSCRCQPCCFSLAVMLPCAEASDLVYVIVAIEKMAFVLKHIPPGWKPILFLWWGKTNSTMTDSSRKLLERATKDI